MRRLRTAILHYSSPPVVGGVEGVIYAQAEALARAGYPVTVISGRGSPDALPAGVSFVSIREMDSEGAEVSSVSRSLEAGSVPASFEELTVLLLERLERSLAGVDAVIVHNLFTKHFNLPLTAALARFLERHDSIRCIAWCHDFTWTSEHSRSKVHSGYPWDLLRSRLPRVVYVTISGRRRSELAELLGCREEEVVLVYNGVEASTLFGLSGAGLELVERLGLLHCDLALLMPVRVTQAKNIELAIRLAAELKAREVGSRIVVTGPPDPHDPLGMPYYESLRALRKEQGVEREMSFVYESGQGPDRPLLIGMEVVAQLYRVCDLLFMPSRREGFGMPILEAGLLGMPIVTSSVPAAEELAARAALIFDPETDPAKLADELQAFVRTNEILKFRLRIRRELTWEAIFRRQVQPLLTGHTAAGASGERPTEPGREGTHGLG